MFSLDRYKSKTTVIADRNESLSYGQVAEEVEDFTVHYKDDFVSTLCENLLGAFIGYVACINKHIPQVLLDGSKNLESVQRLTGIYQPEYIQVPAVHVNEIGGKSVYTYRGYSLRLMTHDEPLIDRTISSELLLCLITSGNTDSPKLVRLSKRNLKSGAESITDYLKVTSSERPMTSLPVYYNYGMSIVNSHLTRGATILLTDRTVMQREFWTFIKEQKATPITGVPYAYEVLK